MSEAEPKPEFREDRESAMADEEVVAAVLSGNTALYELLMRRYNQRIYRTVLGIIGRPEDAEDAVQHAWLEAWRNLGSFERRSSFPTWVTRIAVNSAFGRIRREGRAIELATPDRSGPESESATPEVMAMSSQMREILEREILVLPRDYRIVLALRDVEGMSTAECADSLGVTEGVVRTRLHRARAMLRERLEKLEAGEMTGLMAFAGHRCDRAVTGVLNAISGESKTR